MAVETHSLFSKVIEEHLELKRRNQTLQQMPIDRYMHEDPFENHPLFKTEEQARLEETLDGTEPAVMAHTLTWPVEETPAAETSEDGLWARSRDFDWGD